MKNLFLGLSFLVTISSFAQNTRAYMGHNTFYSPKDGPYIETYVSIDGTSVEWKKNTNNKYQASVELTLIFEKDSSIVDFSKVIIKSKEVSDSAEMRMSFMNTQRFAIPSDKYILKIKIDDLNDTLKADYILSSLKIDMPDTSASISSIEVVKQLSKSSKEGNSNHSGFSFIPNIYNYLPEEDSIFTFYAELYHINLSIDDNEPYILNYYFSSFETSQILPKFRRYEKRKAKSVDAILGQFDIAELPSGNYVFTMELIDKNMALICKKDYFFQRENTNVNLDKNDIESVNIINTFAELITGKDTLEDIIKSMRPISTNSEVEFAKYIMKGGDEKIMQQYIYNFWQKRNPLEPSKPFIAYMIEVMRVNKEFKTSIKKGYETARGIVYLKYGQPNSIMKEYHEPSTYPYEIWHYYGIRGQSNVKFVFYDTDLSTNDFTLLHSNAIGEISNYNWRLQLRKRDSGYRSIDQTGQDVDEWGTRYNEYYEQPR
jgi:GWxTD domain-containing protein